MVPMEEWSGGCRSVSAVAAATRVERCPGTGPARVAHWEEEEEAIKRSFWEVMPKPN